MPLLKVHIEYLDGRPSEDQDMPANYGPGQEKAVIPISSIKSVRVTVPSVVVANSGDLLSLDAAWKAQQVIKL